jgi:hypothetical protein
MKLARNRERPTRTVFALRGLKEYQQSLTSTELAKTSSV